MNAKFADKVFRVFFVLALVLGNVWTPGTQAKARNATDFVPHTISTWQDEYGRWWVENDYYRIELTEFSSFAVKSGEDEREWRIYTTWPWIGSHAVTFSGQSYRLLYGGESPVVVELLEQTSDHVIFRVTSTASGDGSPIVLHNTLFFLVNSPAIRVDSELLGDTISSRFEAVTYNLFLSAGGDISNDWYTWPGGDRYPFPYDYWRTIYGPEFAPIDNQIYIAAYDTAVLQGMALIGNYNDTTEFTTDMTYGRASVEGAIGYFDPDILLSMIAGRKTSFFIHPFDVEDPNPVAEIESFIQILSSNQPPVADAGGPYTGIAGDSITLDASASSDPEAGALTYEWDLDNDSKFDDATGITTATVFNQVGEHTVGLRVTDSFGLTSTDTAIVTITNPPEPGPFDKSSPSDGTVDVSASPTLSWNTGSGATSYEYCYDTTDNNTCDDSWISTEANTSAELSSLSSNTTYYWQVRAINAGGATYADNNTWWSFTTAVQNQVETISLLDDPTGGDCATIGNWDALTKTCVMTRDVDNTAQDISPAISIYGEGVTLDGNGHSVTARAQSGTIGVHVFANDVTIKNLEIVNANIYAPYYKGTTITGNTITDFWGSAVQVIGVGTSDESEESDITISNNTLTFDPNLPREGGNLIGISVGNAKNYNISGNQVNGFDTSIWIEGGRDAIVSENTVDNTIIANSPGQVIRNNTLGYMYINAAPDSIISGNTIGGFAVWNTSNITIYNNNIYGTTDIRDSENLSFNQDLPVGGNYWSTFDSRSEGCFDLNLDGLCDAPYIFEGGQDNLPWTRPDRSINQLPVAEAGGPYAGFAGDSITLDASASSDPDGEALTYEWDLDNDGEYDDATGVSVTAVFNQAGQHTIGLRVADPSDSTSTDTAIVLVNAYFGIWPLENRLEGRGWLPNSPVQVSVDDPATGPGADHSVTVDSDYAGNFYYYGYWGGFDLRPGFLVTIDDGVNTVKEQTIAGLSFTGADHETETIFGTATPGAVVDIWGCGDNGCATRHETADENGNWIADFATPGIEPDEQDIINLLPDNGGGAKQSDADGDFTQINWYVPNPRFGIWPVQHELHSWGWLPNAPVELTVNDPSTGPGADFSTTLTSNASGSIDYWFEQDIDLRPGALVTLNGGANLIRELTIADLTITAADPETDVIHGTGDPGAVVNVITYYSANRHEIADGDGNWIANFAIPGDEADEQDILDLQPATNGYATQNDDDGDFTQIYWQVPNPSFGIWLMDNTLQGWGWWLSSPVQISVDDPATGPGTDFSTTVISDGGGTFSHSFGGEIDLRPGFLVTLDGGADLIREQTIASLNVTEADPETDMIHGVADPGSLVTIWICGSDRCGTRHETADASGNWSANFAVPGDEPDEQDTVELQSGTFSDARQTDEDGDFTQIRWGVLTPYFGITLPDGYLYGSGWMPYRPVEINVDDPSTGAEVDFSTTLLSDYWGNIHYQFGQDIDLQPGFIVSASHMAGIKELVISSWAAVGNAQTDTVSGTANPGNRVNIWACDASGAANCTNRHETADMNGNWTANFAVPGDEFDEQNIIDIGPGTRNYANQYDDDGDYTQIYWRAPNPAFNVWMYYNQVHGYDWLPYSLVTLTVDDPDLPGSPDYTVTENAGNAPWDSSGTTVLFNPMDDFQFRSGQTVTLTSGLYSRTHIITDLVVTSISPDTNIITGTATPGIGIHISNTGNSQIWRNEIAAADGTWTANFNIVGDEQGEEVADINPGDEFSIGQTDADGDGSFWFLRVPNPNLVVQKNEDIVHAHDWPLGNLVTLTIDDPATYQPIDYTDSQVAHIDLEHEGPEQTWVSFNLKGIYDVKSGDFVTLSDGITTEQHTVTRLQITNVNVDNDTISGIAESFGELYVDAPFIYGPSQNIVADQDGNWIADFSGLSEIVRGMEVRANELDANDNSTMVTFNVPNPSISVRMLEKRVQAYGWLLGSSVTLYLDDPNIPGSPDYTDTQTVGVADWDPNSTLVEFQVGDEIALKPGLLVTMTDGDIVKTHTATNLVVTGVDPETDTVFGTAEPGSFVHVGHLCENNICAFRYVTVDENGNWIADFAHPGEDSNEQDLFDIRPGTNNEARQHDSDGDATQYGWRVPNPQITVGTEWDAVFGHDWPLGATVYLAIDDPSTGPGLDYSDSQVVTGEPLNTRLDFNLRGFDVQPSHIVTFTHDTFSKELVVSHMKITDIDADLDLVFGTADPVGEIQIDVRQSGGGPPSSQTLYLTADQNGDWIADFAGVWDITADHEVFAHEVDGDGDVTMDIHGFPNPTFSARLTDNEVHGYEWPLGASVTLRIDDPNTPQPIDYTKTQTANVADWDPNQTFVQFRLWEEGFTLDHGMTVTMSDGITTKTHIVTSITVTAIDPEADTISGTASPNAQVDIGHIFCDENSCSGFRRVFADSNGDWIADFAHAGEDDDEQDIIDITAGMGSEARECDDDGECTTYGWYVFAYTLHAVPTHPEVHGHDWPWGAEVTLTVDDDADPNNGVLYTRTKNADDDSWCGYPCFDLSGVFDLQTGQYVTMTDGTVTKTVQVSSLKITSVDMENETLSGIADPGSDVMVNIWSQDGKARHTVADSNGDWAVDFSVFGDEDFEQFTTDIGYGDDGHAIQLNPDGTDDGTLEYWNQDWVAPDTIPLVVAMPFWPSLDRVEYTFEAWTIYNLLWEPLFRTTDQGTPVPAAASEYTVSADGLVYTITLQDGLLWSDGQPVTAQHYVDGFLRILSPESVDGFGSLLYDIQGAQDFSTGVTNDPNDVGLRALNAQTLQITLAHPAVYFLQILADPGMAPARLDLIAQHGDAWIAPENFVGNGPYTLTEYDSGHLLLQKNLQFHDAASVSIGQIAFDIIEDENERFEAYKRGDVDVLMDAPQSALDDPNFDQERVYSASPGVMYVGLNTQRTPTDDPQVRKALASAIDRRTLLDTVLNTPWLQEATGIIPPELQSYQGEAVGYEYNPAYAQGLLAGAGYPGGAGLPTVHMYGNDTLWDRTIMEAVADQWRNVLNISVETHYTEDFRSWISNCENDTGACDYNAFRAGWYIDYYDPHNIINDLFNPDTSFARRTGWDDTRYRELIELSREEMDPAQRVAYLQEAEQILVEEDVAVIPLYFTERVSLIKPGFQPAFGIVPYFDQWNMLADTDGDGIEDLADNAPTIYNPDQRDVDNDGTADVLDLCPADPTDACNVSGSAAGVMGVNGGVVNTSNGKVSLNIPAGALSEDISFSITDMGGGYEVATYQGAMSIFQSYSIQPHGTYFNEPATITFHWDDTNNDGVVDGTALLESRILLIKDGLILTPSCSVNPDCNMGSNTLTVQVTDLSLFELAVPILQYTSFVVLGREGVWLKENSDVMSGDVGANISASGPYLTDQSEVTMGQDVQFMDPVSRLMGDTVYLKQGSQVYDVYANELKGQGQILGVNHTSLELPLVPQLPAVPNVNPGTQNFDLKKNATLTLDAGSYGKLETKKGAVITFTGGVYHFSEWTLGDDAKIYFAAPTEIRIAGKLDIGSDAFIGPATGTDLSAHDILIYVMGNNGKNGKINASPKAALFGTKTTLIANVYAPNGTLWIHERSTATGAFFGKWVEIGQNVTLSLDNGWH